MQQAGRRPHLLRGTVKLAHALTTFGVCAVGVVALDLGAAAGGFTQALLDAGAACVYAVDAGVGQLRGWLRADPRVVNLERTNLAQLDRHLIGEPVDLVTMDLSYLAVAQAIGQIDRQIHPPRYRRPPRRALACHPSCPTSARSAAGQRRRWHMDGICAIGLRIDAQIRDRCGPARVLADQPSVR
jgi:hypothetical protein